MTSIPDTLIRLPNRAGPRRDPQFASPPARSARTVGDLDRARRSKSSRCRRQKTPDSVCQSI
jgi:hypothetical protein